jgi:hypothetical protein
MLHLFMIERRLLEGSHIIDDNFLPRSVVRKRRASAETSLPPSRVPSFMSLPQRKIQSEV